LGVVGMVFAVFGGSVHARGHAPEVVTSSGGHAAE
jgi:hypothetical protein